jgi:protein involved in ribonucleotide reduction
MKLTKQLLREMILREMATFQKAKDKIGAGKTFAVFSTYRGERSARQNRAVDQQVREFLNSTGYPYTVVEGGYKETPKNPETGEPTGEESVSQIEKSYLVFEDETRPDVPKTDTSLFDVANKACAMSDQESFSYGYSRTIVEPTGEERQEPFIAIYPTGAPGPGEDHRIKKSWAGPWNSLDKMMNDTGYYTKVRGTKATFAESIRSLKQQVRNSKSELEKRNLRYQIEVLLELQRTR